MLPGLVLPADLQFAEVIRPLSAEIAPCFWLISHHLENQADFFLFYGDGWWEMYTPHAQWRRKFRSAFPKSYERSWRKAGEPPSIA